MQRRGASGRPAKGQRRAARGPKTRKSSSAPYAAEQFDRLKRELDEAREQQTATAEILKMIKTSPADAQPVFETIVRNAVALCGGLFANGGRVDGQLGQWVAAPNVGPD